MGMHSGGGAGQQAISIKDLLGSGWDPSKQGNASPVTGQNANGDLQVAQSPSLLPPGVQGGVAQHPAWQQMLSQIAGGAMQGDDPQSHLRKYGSPDNPPDDLQSHLRKWGTPDNPPAGVGGMDIQSLLRLLMGGLGGK